MYSDIKLGFDEKEEKTQSDDKFLYWLYFQLASKNKTDEIYMERFLKIIKKMNYTRKAADHAIDQAETFIKELKEIAGHYPDRESCETCEACQHAHYCSLKK